MQPPHLHTVLDCPSGTFIGAGVKTVVLFFEKGTRIRGPFTQSEIRTATICKISVAV